MPDPTPAPSLTATPAPTPTPTPSPTPAPAPSTSPAPSPTPSQTPTPSPDPSPTPTPTESNAWGDNWRQTYAGQDEKLLKRLERYASPKAALDALISAQNKISAGELVKPLSDNPTPEEIAAYRAQHGIPEKPEGYLEKLPNGLVIGEGDKPIVDSFVDRLHKLNADPKLVHEAVSWYYDFQEQQVAERQTLDLSQKTEAEDALRAEWGQDYRTNINHINSFLSTAPEGVADMITNARTGDGKALFNDQKFVGWIASLAREANPVGTIVPAGPGSQSDNAVAEIARIEKLMGNKNSEYWKGAQAESLQKRYRDLIDFQSKQQARGAALK